MKKVFLSAMVIAAFLIYSYHQRHDGSAAVRNVQKPSATRTTASARTSTQTATQQNTTQQSSSTSSANSSTPASNGKYKNGTYAGVVADAFYGSIQVQAVISGG